MKKIQLVALVLVLLQACAPDTITGTGPVTLTYYQQQAFDKWRKGKTAEDPLYFFLRKGGGLLGLLPRNSNDLQGGYRIQMALKV